MSDSTLQPESKKHKFRELKVYASTEWLADNKKKYRQVFDRYETAYIYAELSFYNKFFDLDDWDIKVELRCYSVKKGRVELCNLSFNRKVSKYDNTVYIREGWGNKKEGAFWKKGSYYWEAWVEEEKVATKYFYVEDTGMELTHDINPYLAIESVQLYEGPYEDVTQIEKSYYSAFDSEESRYIYVDLVMNNMNLNRVWQCEMFIKFYNDAHELKGQVVKLHRVERKDDKILITAGWGSNVKGSWRKDRYSIAVVFMDILLATIPFEVGDVFETGVAKVLMPNHQQIFLSTPNIEEQNFEEVLAKLDELVGLSDIKLKVREHAQFIQFLNLRREKGFNESENIGVHSVFTGNPGTGKTTVAKMMGRLYKMMGLLSKGHVHEVDRVDLVGEYIGQTAPKVKDAIESAQGGVLFIDEAYSLARSNDDSKDFGREVIEILVKEMSSGNNDFAVIVAGYPKEMKHFMDSNPGLKSRFKQFFDFTDYLPQELLEIADYACHEKGVILDIAARDRIFEIIVESFRTRDRTFGNARYIHDLIDKAKMHLGLRIMSMPNPRELSRDEISTILLQDVNKINIKNRKPLPNIPVDEALLTQTLKELDDMIGMTNVKQQIHETVRLVRFYKESGKDVLGTFFLHTVLIGNPGTGKTTIARIVTRLYKALGILERGHIVETDRQGLVAGYVGQTAIKTAEKIEEATGGVLFIDEAYALTSGGNFAHGDFGSEAIQTLLKRMEDRRGEFFVFVAGYPDNMDNFMKANPGLTSRFDKTLRFEDYSPEELGQIAMQMLEQLTTKITPDAEIHLKKYLAYLHNFRDRYFGNARVVRNIVNDAIKNHNLRLAALPLNARNAAEPNTLTIEDVAAFKLDKSAFSVSRRGINLGGSAASGGA